MHPVTGDLACNPGMCPRLGIEPATNWFAGQHPIHWAKPARAVYYFFLKFLFIDFREGGREILVCALIEDWTHNLVVSVQCSNQPSCPARAVFIHFKEGEREREKHQHEKHWLVASRLHPDQGSNTQRRYVPWPEIEPPTSWCMLLGWHFNQLNLPARSWFENFIYRFFTQTQ